MPLRCIIVEDQPPAQRILQTYIADMGTLDLRGTLSDPVEAMDFLREETIDLMFLDIQLPKLSGIELLQALSHPPQVILTTAYADYALQGYELNVVDYLLKPFSFQRFVKAVQKAIPPAGAGGMAEVVPRSLFIKSGYEHIRVHLSDILFLHADADYTEIHVPGKKHLSSDTLRTWEARLPEPSFFRIHKSYIVQLDQVEKVAGNQLYLHNGTSLPIGRAYKEAFMARIAGGAE
ncbi:MAG: DNA-binding response regulator [Bacteroidetes bacterium]|nr:MAG: DNA-binding response regulator [Bacteroidota bacterium]